MGTTYKEAGVDIEAGESAVKRIKEAVKSTYNDHVLSDIGAFGGFFSFPKEDYDEPVLVSSTDGVGTKLRVAFKMGVHNTVGQDLVNHCVDDILTSGATPLFFLDYIGIGVMKEEVVVDVIGGFAKACKENECVLIGGEMAEMAGFYQPGEYDIAGTIVGVVEREHLISGNTIQQGDIAIGLPSNGLHTNGYTLARKVLLEEFDPDSEVDDLSGTVGETLLAVHKSYLPEIRPLIGDHRLKGISHITGGGLLGNTKRIIPDGFEFRVNWEAWEVPPVFQLIQRIGGVNAEEMRRTFNMGIGLVVITSPEDESTMIQHFRKHGLSPVVIGEIVKN